MDLRVNMCGMEFINPFILASAPPTARGDMIKRAFHMGWSGAVLKTIKPDELDITDVTPRYAFTKSNKGEFMGMQNIELVTKKPVSYWIQQIKELKEEFPEHQVIPSIMAGVEKSQWQILSRQMEKAGADALELNFSCPHGMPEHGIGSAIGQDKDISKNITMWVKEAVSIPVIVKLSPNVTDITHITSGVIEAEADAVAAINTVQSLIGIDLNDFTPKPDVFGYSTYGGYSGRAVKPIGLRCVAQVANYCDIPISGMGGISTWEDAVEYLLVGSSTLQICTEVMLNGYGIIDGLQNGLKNYLTEKNLGIEEIIGKALPKLTSHESLRRDKMTAKVEGNCIRCGKCILVCQDSADSAVFYNGSGIAEVDPKLCNGCSLCTHICPTNAIAMGCYK